MFAVPERRHSFFAMAIPLLPIIKTLPTVVAAVREVTASVKERRATGVALKVEERVRKLEEDLVKAGNALAELGTQVQAIAEELRAEEVRETSRARQLLIWKCIAGASLGVSVIALVTALVP